jgi:hypothetical protein
VDCLAFLKAATQEKPIPGEKWAGSFLPTRRDEYLKFQLEREKTAKGIYYLTTSLTNGITTKCYLNECIRKEL